MFKKLTSFLELQLINKEITFLLFLGLYFIYNLLIKLLLSSTLEIDESEQAFLSQEFRWGYNQQPPLYTWITILILKIFGYCHFSFLIFRSVLLFFIHFFIFRISKILNQNLELAITVSLSLLLFFQFSVESFRQTHTVLVTFSTCLFLYLIIKMQKKSTFFDYVLLGVILAVGVLSKFNFIIILFSVLTLINFDYDLKKIFINKNIILSISIFFLIIFKHGIWFIENYDTILNETTSDLKVKNTSYMITILPSTYVFFKGFLSFSIAFLLVVFLFFKNEIKHFFIDKKKLEITFLLKVILISLFLFLLIVILSKANKLHERWLQPVLILLPIVILGNLHKYYDIKLKKLNKILILIAILIMVYIPCSILFGPKLGFYERVNKPYKDFSILIKNENLLNDVDLIFCDEYEVAGNLKLYLPDKKIDILKDGKLFFNYPVKSNNKIILIKQANNNQFILPKSLEKVKIEKTIVKKLNYNYSKNEKIIFKLLILQTSLINKG